MSSADGTVSKATRAGDIHDTDHTPRLHSRARPSWRDRSAAPFGRFRPLPAPIRPLLPSDDLHRHMRKPTGTFRYLAGDHGSTAEYRYYLYLTSFLVGTALQYSDRTIAVPRSTRLRNVPSAPCVLNFLAPPGGQLYPLIPPRPH
jgi:hypothetical protein